MLISRSERTTPCNARVHSALQLQRAGWKVFPLHSAIAGACSCGKPKCSSVGKHPRTRNGLRDASAQAEHVHRWWTDWPDANIGLATGNGLVVLDLDSEAAVREAESRG